MLTGSTRYSVLPQAAQSLTGRAHVINVLPLSQGAGGSHDGLGDGGRDRR